MKLVVTGATGLVGTEVIRQALHIPSITSVIALTRTKVQVPNQLAPNADTGKLRSVLVDFEAGEYSQEVKEQLKGVDACLWLLAVTPSKMKALQPELVRKICLDYMLTGLKEMSSVANKPFRFIYTSGAMTERDQTKQLMIMAEYRLMRGECENRALAFAAASSNAVEVQITKPGLISGPGRGAIVAAGMAAASLVGVMSTVHVSEIAAAMLQQADKGLEKDTLENADLVRIGKEVVGPDGYVTRAQNTTDPSV